VAESVDLGSTEPAQFKGPWDVVFSCREPVVKAAMLYLGESWPQATPFEDLQNRARMRVSGGVMPDAATVTRDTLVLGHTLLASYSTSRGLVELSASPPRFVVQVTASPLASPLARLQAGAGSLVTNLRHEKTTLDEFERQLLPYLDGEHDRAALLDILIGLTTRGDLLLKKDGVPIQDPQTLREQLPLALEQQLHRIARQGLLMG
jgi:hypothetical protein